MKFYLLILICSFILFQTVFSQFPIEQYTTEISQLKNEKEIQDYWNKLLELDQKILLQEKNQQKYDSISTDIMIRTILLFQEHGTKGFNQFGNILPIVNLTHCNLGKNQLNYWPIILKLKQLGGIIESLGGTYPSYQLETISLTFYNYSLLNQADKLPKLLGLVNNVSSTKDMVERMSSYYFEHIKRQNLTVKSMIGSWFYQPFKHLKEETNFEFLLLSDNHIYVKYGQYLQRFELATKNWTFC